MDHGRSSADDELLRRLDALERRTSELESLVSEKDAVIAIQREQIAAQQETLDHAQEQLVLLRKAMFAPRRERYTPAPNQSLLFETLPLDSGSSKVGATQSEATTVDERPSRKARRKFVIPSFLPVRREEHRLPPDQCPCGNCGRERVVIGTQVTRQIELEAAKAYVVEHIRYTYACSACRAGDQVVTTQKPPAPIDKSPFGPSVLAWIVSAKFERHLPTYRHQEMLVAPLGLWLSRPLLAAR